MSKAEEICNMLLQRQGFIVVGGEVPITIPSIGEGLTGNDEIGDLNHKVMFVSESSAAEYAAQLALIGLPSDPTGFDYYYRAVAE